MNASKIFACILIVTGAWQLGQLAPEMVQFIGSAYRQSFQQNQPTQEDQK